MPARAKLTNVEGLAPVHQAVSMCRLCGSRAVERWWTTKSRAIGPTQRSDERMALVCATTSEEQQANRDAGVVRSA